MGNGAPSAFLSYSREDSDFALRLAGDLKVAGGNVWLDQLDIVPGQRWDRTVEEALLSCPRLLVILTPAAVISANVMDEVSFALEEKKTVIPVIYKDCAIPFRLRRVQHVDVRRDYALGLKELLKILAPAANVGETTPGIYNVAAPRHSSTQEDEGNRLAEEERSHPEQPQVDQDREQAAAKERRKQKRKPAAEQTRQQDETRKAPEPTSLEDERERAAERARLENQLKREEEQQRPEQERQKFEAAGLEERHTEAAERAPFEKQRAKEETKHDPELAREHVDVDVQPQQVDNQEVPWWRLHLFSKPAVWIALSVAVATAFALWFYQRSGALLTLSGNVAPITSVALTPDGEQVVSGSADSTLKVWDLKSGQQVRTLGDGGSFSRELACDRDSCGYPNGINSVVISPDGGHVISARWGFVNVWDLKSGSEEYPLRGGPENVDGWWQQRINSVAVSSVGGVVVSGGNDNRVEVWDLHNGRAPLVLTGHSGPVNCVAVTADGRTAVSASKDKTIKIWNLQTGNLTRTLVGHSEAVNGIAITADGRTVISGSDDKTLKIWDLESGNLVRTLVGHSEAVNGVAVTPNGRFLLSASSDKSVRVWDLQSGRAERELTGHSQAVVAVAVSSNGRYAVSASWDKTLKVWDLAALLKTGN